jgi:hypothetical protein
MKLEACRKGEDIRMAMIREIESTLEMIFKRYGSHENLATIDLAIKLTDEIDFDRLKEIIE